MNGDELMYAKKVKKHAISASVLSVKMRLRNTLNRLAYTCMMLFWIRFSGVNVSGNLVLQNIRMMPTPSSNPNTPYQLVNPAINPPITGAQTGAIPLMEPRIAIKLASSLPLYISVLILLEITMPPAPANPWKSRIRLKI